LSDACLKPPGAFAGDSWLAAVVWHIGYRMATVPGMAKKGPGKRKGAKPPPKCKAILLCDQIIADAMTGKASVIGIFDAFRLPKVPYFSRECSVYLQLIEGIGEYKIVIEVHDLRDGLILTRTGGFEVRWSRNDRLARITLIIPIQPIPISHPWRV
jgi:hypothetical protein